MSRTETVVVTGASAGVGRAAARRFGRDRLLAAAGALGGLGLWWTGRGR